jgi:hypothetical protein
MRAPRLDHLVAVLRKDLGFRVSEEVLRQAEEMAAEAI